MSILNLHFDSFRHIKLLYLHVPKSISKVLIILANPEYEQDNRAETITGLCKTFIESAKQKGFNTDIIDLYREDFDPIYFPEKRDTKALEYQIRIKKADLIAVFHPVWLNTMPAILKGFLDKVFTPGFGFRVLKKAKEPLLKDKLAVVLTVGEQTNWEYNLIFRNMLKNFWQKGIFDPCGVKSKYIQFGNLRKAKDKDIKNWNKKVEKLVNSFNSNSSLIDLI